jgi:hypothetical protein
MAIVSITASTRQASGRTTGRRAPHQQERRRVDETLLVINFTMTRHNAAASVHKLCMAYYGKQLVDVLSIKSAHLDAAPEGKPTANS